MLGFRVCWQLLLGWALLLGQPVFGDSDASEEFSLPVAAGPVATSPEPEVPVPVSEESEEAVSDLEEPELPVAEELEEKELTSDEKLENDESEERQWLQEDLSTPFGYEMHYMQRMVLQHHHEHSEEYYRPFDNANLRTEKAIGTMIYLDMTLKKTNCTNDQRGKEDSDHSYYYRLYHADRYPRNCEPLSDSEEEILDCKFTMFEDARDPANPFVIDQECYRSDDVFRRRMFLPPDLFR